MRKHCMNEQMKPFIQIFTAGAPSRLGFLHMHTTEGTKAFWCMWCLTFSSTLLQHIPFGFLACVRLRVCHNHAQFQEKWSKKWQSLESKPSKQVHRSLGLLHAHYRQYKGRLVYVNHGLHSLKHYSHYQVWIPSIMTTPNKQHFSLAIIPITQQWGSFFQSTHCVGDVPTITSRASMQQHLIGNNVGSNCVGRVPTLATPTCEH